MSEPEFPVPYLTAVGRLAVVSSTLDHTAALLLVCVEGRALRDYTGARQNRKDLRRAIRRAASARVIKGELSRELETFVVEWVATTMDLLAERDRVIHALWGLDPETQDILGQHRTGAPPTTAEGIMDVVDRSRAHVLELTEPRQRALRALAADG